MFRININNTTVQKEKRMKTENDKNLKKNFISNKSMTPEFVNVYEILKLNAQKINKEKKNADKQKDKKKKDRNGNIIL